MSHPCVPRPRRPLLAARSLALPRSQSATTPMNPDRLAELEDERRFLLRSLRDLDAELDAGDVDIDDYATLRDGYTKRAADVLRDIEEGQGRAARPAAGALVEAAGHRRGRVAGRPRRRLARRPLVGAAPGRRGQRRRLGAPGRRRRRARPGTGADRRRSGACAEPVRTGPGGAAGSSRGAGLLRVPAVRRVGRRQRRAAPDSGVGSARAAGQGRRGRPAVRRPALLPGRDRRRRRRARDGPTRARPVLRPRPASSAAWRW